ncbi:amidohydrolase family protein [Amycolatopsis sp. FDAARGOS 1241]|uniref:amidohydrolase family protein n=1 Tax=Amycolatopsis sp. FDAARGOS 1241 TaxID=2778070 RepID=UPI001952629B|nr:amidohydrolase family protein [Amycolatopsis sp. FDAARGOS 1241]QRP48062.1 amidohydrolase family protein [Amycolatopsis sp. FDAARGOS 1241]
MRWLADAHRHLGVLPAHPFYGGPPIAPAIGSRATIAELLSDLDREGTERALVLPNYGVPDPAIAFSFNELCVEAAGKDDRIAAALWVSPRAEDATRTEAALKLAGEPGVRALKLSFLLGGRASDPACTPQLDRIFATARELDLVVHVHTSPGAASDVDEVGKLVGTYADDVKVHLVHFGGGMSGHLKLAGGRFFDWIAAGKQVYTDLSWAIGFTPRWLAEEISRRGIGHDRVLFASDEPWGDHEGELAKLSAAVGDGELADHVFRSTFEVLYGPKKGK